MKKMKDIKNTFTGSLKFGDEVDTEIFEHMLCSVPPVYGTASKKHLDTNNDSISFCLKEQCDIDVELTGIMQNGEPYDFGNQGATYMSIGFTTDDRFFWLGTLPNKYKVQY